MRSLLWSGIFCLLVVELVLTLLLAIPVPRKIRNKIAMAVSKLELRKKLQTPITGLVIVLVLAIADTATFLANLYDQKEQAREQHLDGNGNFVDRHIAKEREYKAGRNLYLASFALTLLFVIGRIAELMQEHAELEGKLENLRIASSMAASAESKPNRRGKTGAAAGDNDVPTEGIEMKPMGLKKKE